LELPPADELPDALPSVAICLYHLSKRSAGVVSDPEHREIEEAEDGTLQEFRKRKPLHLDLRFLVTVYCESHRDELSMLGLCLQALYDAPVILDEIAMGDSIHTEDRPGLDVARATHDEVRSIWESFQQPYRPSFTCSIEARLDSKVKHLIRRVREAIVDFKKMDG
jgi:hypothetical protein